MQILPFAALVMATAALPAAAKERSVPVSFAKGAHAATLKGSVKGGDVVRYTVATVPGQTMQMLFRPSLNACTVNVFAPGNATAVHIGAAAGNEYGARIETGGQYRFEVGMMRVAARRGATCRYQLSLEITGAPGGASSGVSDLMMRDLCKGNAAPMYGVEPRAISATGRIVKSRGGYTIDATADKGADGLKRLRCIFKPDRQLDHIQAMTSDGRL